jgi:hypothetical protein
MTCGGYAKLFSLILSSSIWGEDDRTRIVWITMLAMKNMHGIVNASFSGLARMANVPEDAVRIAIEKLEAPDPDSRTKDHDGRRIIPVEGGWAVVNHAKYRATLSDDPEAISSRERVRRWRQKHGDATSTPPPAPPNTENTDNTYTDTDTALRAVTLPKRNVTPCNTLISVNELGEPSGGKKFKKPSLDDVKAYIAERNSSVDPELFFSHYEANGWVQGNRGKPVRNWKACVVTWEKGNFRFGKAKSDKTDYSKGF